MIVALLVGASLTLRAKRSYLRFRWITSGWPEVDAVITDIEREETDLQPDGCALAVTLEFVTLTGLSVSTARTNWTHKTDSVGATLKVRYDPKQPSTFMTTDEVNAMYDGAGCSLCLGIVVILLAAAFVFATLR